MSTTVYNKYYVNNINVMTLLAASIRKCPFNGQVYMEVKVVLRLELHQKFCSFIAGLKNCESMKVIIKQKAHLKRGLTQHLSCTKYVVWLKIKDQGVQYISETNIKGGLLWAFTVCFFNLFFYSQEASSADNSPSLYFTWQGVAR